MGDVRFEKLCRKYIELGLPAVWVSVADRGRLFGASCAGFRDIKANTPTSLSDHVGYGSITKPFTGLLVATLVAEGSLSYDQPAITYLPDLASSFGEARKAVTLGQLITHMAGFPAGPPEPKQRFDSGTAYRRQFALNGLSQPLANPIGTYRYSNIGITIAALTAERVTGKTWEQLIKERVTNPLGLTSVAPYPLVDDKIVHSYEFGASGLLDTINQEPIQRNRFGPAGSLRGTVADLMKFGLAFLDAKSLPPPIQKAGIYPLLVHAAPQSEMSYCGMGSTERPGNTFRLSHNGSLEFGRYRAYANLRVNSQQGRSVAILTNVYGLAENEYSKRIRNLVGQMNNEIENYL